MQSKAGQPLARYFPELVQAFLALEAKQYVLDGEIVILRGHTLSFDDLLMRIHPAASRIKKLSEATPASFFAFDILVDQRGKSLVDEPLRERRKALEEFFRQISRAPLGLSGRRRPEPRQHAIRLSPSSPDVKVAQRWMGEGLSTGLDGVIAKRIDVPYASGERTAMQKIKRIRTADCVVGGFRYATKGKAIGSLLLGLYNEHGQLDHIGFTSSFTAEQRRDLKKVIDSLKGGEGFSGKAPGGPSRWSTERSGEWERLKPKLVCEVRYDYFSGGRFRHGTKFLRWRPEKLPKQCTFDQVRGPAVEPDLVALGLA
jgi:ATP-dependent DNA ligase